MKKDKLYAVNKGNSPIINGNLFDSGGIKINWNNPFDKNYLGNTLASAATALPDSMYNTLDPMYHIAGGRESGIGNALNSAGIGLFKTGASTGNAPLMIAGAAAKVGGGLYNTLFGTKWNQNTINSFNNKLNALNSFNADTSSNDSFMASIQNNIGPVSRLSKSDVGKDGLFSNKVSKKTNELNALGDIANSRYSYGLNMGAFNTDKKNDARLFAGSYAFGGPIVGALGIMQNDKYINAINNRSDALAQKGSVFTTSPQLGQSNSYPDGGLLEAAFIDDFKTNPLIAAINYNRGLEQLQAEREAKEIEREREQDYLNLQKRMQALESDNMGLQIALNSYRNQPTTDVLDMLPYPVAARQPEVAEIAIAPNDTAIMARMRKSLSDRGVNKRTVQDAVIANMMVESGGNPNAKNPKSSARGLMQWTTPRHPKAWDWDSQVDHIVNTLESGFANKKVFEQFMNTNDSAEAARIFRQYWERPEKHTYNWTDKYINQMYNQKAMGGNLYATGGPEGDILGLKVPSWVETTASFVPFLGTAMDIKEAIQNPSWGNIGTAGLSLLSDLSGTALLRGAFKASNYASKLKKAEKAVSKAAKTAGRTEDYSKLNKAQEEVRRLQREISDNDVDLYLSTPEKFIKGSPIIADLNFNAKQHGLYDNKKAFGGELGTNGTDFTNGILEINAGGTHAMNPFGGVPLGLDPQGQPNLVEEGETVFNDYVFSNRLNVPQGVKKELGLGGYINKDISFADASKYLAKESEERPNDPISMNGLRDSMSKLAAIQEEERMRQQMLAMEEGLQFACGGKKYSEGGNMFRTGGRKRGRQPVTEDEYSDTTREGMGSGRMYPGALNPYSSPFGILEWINDISRTTDPDQMVYTGVAPMPSRYPGRISTRQQLTGYRQAFNNSKANARANFKATKNTPKPQQKPVGAKAGSGMKESYKKTTQVRPETTANESQAYGYHTNYPNQTIGGGVSSPYSALEPGSLGVGNFGRAAYLNRAGALGNQAADYLRNNWQDIAGYGGFGLSTLGVAALAASQRGNNPVGEGTPVQTSTQQTTTNSKQATKKAQKSNTPQASTSASQATQSATTTPTTDSDWRSYMNAPILTLPAFQGYNGTTPNRASSVPGSVAAPSMPKETLVMDGREALAPIVPQSEVVPQAAVVDSNGNYTTLPGFWGNPTYAGARGISSAVNNNPRDFLEKMPTISGYLGPDYSSILAGLAPDNLTENAIKRWQDAYEKSDDVKDKAPYDTWMRYAPVVGAGIMSLTDALGLTNKPDYTYADRLEAAANRAGYAPNVEFNPIGDYMTYKPMDINYGLAQLGAASRANARDIQNVAGTRGGAMAGMLANSYNSQLAEGNLYRQALEYNDALERQVADFNRGTNQFNSQMGLEAALANARYRQGAAHAQLSGLASAYGLRDAIDQRVGAARTANITNLLQGLGNIGTENFALNQIWSIRDANRGLWGKANGTVVREPKSNGGKINRKKK